MERPLASVSVIIPAHNEAGGIARLLGLLASPADDRAVELVVACNGCADNTADVARSVPGVSVVEIRDASKRLALDAGDAVARHEMRAYVDADVAISRAGLLALVDALDEHVLAAVPVRRLATERSVAGVRWYYDVWEQLPAVRTGGFGRGVIVMNAEGHARATRLPKVMSDDLAISEAFAPHERTVVDSAEVTIDVPRTLRDLIGRRVRIATGNSQLDQLGMRSTAAQTSFRDLVAIALGSPTMALKVAWFLVVTAIARRGARRQIKRGDFSTWRRDESSRRA